MNALGVAGERAAWEVPQGWGLQHVVVDDMAANRWKLSGYESRVNNSLALWKRLLNSSHGERSVSYFQACT